MAKEKLEPFKVYIATYQTRLTNKFRARKPWERPDKRQIKAVIPGTILDILVKPNERVKSGETLLVLEAMKMANRITMPMNGRVKAIHVEVGEVVPKHHVMIEIDPDE